MTDARLTSHFLGDFGNDIRADFDFRAPARLGKRLQPCEYAVVWLSADGTDGITTHHRTGQLIVVVGVSEAHLTPLEVFAQPLLVQARCRFYGGTRPAFSCMT